MISRKHELRAGDYPVVCDICGFERWRSECRFNSNKNLVCADKCFEEKHPNDIPPIRRTQRKRGTIRKPPEPRYVEYGEIKAEDL